MQAKEGQIDPTGNGQLSPSITCCYLVIIGLFIDQVIHTLCSLFRCKKVVCCNIIFFFFAMASLVGAGLSVSEVLAIPDADKDDDTELSSVT